MSSNTVMDYAANAYLAITFAPSSPLISQPATLPEHAAVPLHYVGNVGQLQDVHLYSIPKSQYQAVKDQVFAVLGGMPSHIVSVDEQVPKQRAKRVGGEL